MVKYKMGFVPIILAAIIAGGTLVAGGGTYAGVTYYQSSKLIKEADKLVSEGNYTDALVKYDKAKHKWRWAKIETKKSSADELKQLQDYNIEGNKSFGEGEWQKCLEYLGKVTSKFPNYGEVQERYSDCEKKLAEKQATEVAEAEAKKKADEESAKDAAKKKTAPTSTPTSNASSSPSSSSTDQPVAETRPVLYLPFNFNILPDGLMPMGETINHPKPQNPNGHPGIDFQWNNPTSTISILAAMDGEVTGIIGNDYHVGTYDISTKNGRYRVTYTELESLNPNLKVGDTVKVGDLIGHPQHPASVTDQPNYRMIHWEFGYHSDYNAFWGDRLCPMTYFEASAKSKIESIWAATNWPEMKAQFPDICSGDYK